MQDSILTESQELKDKGNRCFVQNDYTQAIELYSKAIDLLVDESLKKNSQTQQNSCVKIIDDTANQIEHEKQPNVGIEDNLETPSCFVEQIDKEINYKEVILDTYKPLMTILMSNRAASHLHQKEYQKAIDDCTVSLELDSKFTKSLLRRATAYEELSKYQEALKDYEAVLALDPTVKQAITATKTLPDKIKEQQEKEKAEMIAKLKDLGNNFLGMFGLSLDNFQINQDQSGSGGYSINFKK